jgi:hypothetical protein
LKAPVFFAEHRLICRGYLGNQFDGFPIQLQRLLPLASGGKVVGLAYDLPDFRHQRRGLGKRCGLGAAALAGGDQLGQGVGDKYFGIPALRQAFDGQELLGVEEIPQELEGLFSLGIVSVVYLGADLTVENR